VIRAEAVVANVVSCRYPLFLEDAFLEDVFRGRLPAARFAFLAIIAPDAR
jgi:hypothetical protein